MTEKKCVRCLLREAYPADYQKYVAGILSTLRGADRADAAQYEARLEACRQCSHLNNGTCMGCGCLVELRAAYKKEKCPFGKW